MKNPIGVGRALFRARRIFPQEVLGSGFDAMMLPSTSAITAQTTSLRVTCPTLLLTFRRLSLGTLATA